GTRAWAPVSRSRPSGRPAAAGRRRPLRRAGPGWRSAGAPPWRDPAGARGHPGGARRVTDPKGMPGETPAMTNASRHIQRRRRAIERLRTLTTGAAVAGVAGTAGFGILAAVSWS